MMGWKKECGGHRNALLKSPLGEIAVGPSCHPSSSHNVLSLRLYFLSVALSQ